MLWLSVVSGWQRKSATTRHWLAPQQKPHRQYPPPVCQRPPVRCNELSSSHIRQDVTPLSSTHLASLLLADYLIVCSKVCSPRLGSHHICFRSVTPARLPSSPFCRCGCSLVSLYRVSLPPFTSQSLCHSLRSAFFALFVLLSLWVLCAVLLPSIAPSVYIAVRVIPELVLLYPRHIHFINVSMLAVYRCAGPSRPVRVRHQRRPQRL